MKSSVEKLPKSRVRFSITVPQERVQKAVDAAYDRLNRQVEVKGFRKGHAPKSKVFESVGLARLRETILQKLLPETYFEALQKEKIVPVEGPQVNIESADWEKALSEGKASAAISYKAEVDILPQVTLSSDYKKIRIKKSEPVEVKDEEVENVIAHLRRQWAEFREVTRAAQNGDRIEIEFEGKVEGVPREEFSSKNYPAILGDGVLKPEFEKELVGLRKGEKKTFQLNMPGKQDPSKTEEVEFSVTVLDLKEMVLPELTEEFARTVGHDSVLSLRGAIKKSLEQNKSDRLRRSQEQEIADQLLSAAKIEVPQALVHQEIHRMIDTLKNQATQYGLSWQSYLSQLKKSEEDLHRDLHNQAEKTVKFGLILGYIINKEKLDPKDKEAGRKAMDKLLEYATQGKKGDL